MHVRVYAPFTFQPSRPRQLHYKDATQNAPVGMGDLSAFVEGRMAVGDKGSAGAAGWDVCKIAMQAAMALVMGERSA